MSPPVEHDSPQIIPERISSPHGVIDVVSPLPSLPTEMSEDHSSSEPEEEKDRQSSKNSISEDEQTEETHFRQDEEEEEDEDYEEVVVKPRPLNEVTSLTDRTSPWTTILSDPELVSVESTEAPKDSDVSVSEGEDENRLISEGKHRAHRSDSSDREPSDTERNNDRTLQEAEFKPNSPDKSSGDSDSSATPPPDSHTRDVSGPQENEDTELQTYP